MPGIKWRAVIPPFAKVKDGPPQDCWTDQFPPRDDKLNVCSDRYFIARKTGGAPSFAFFAKGGIHVAPISVWTFRSVKAGWHRVCTITQARLGVATGTCAWN